MFERIIIAFSLLALAGIIYKTAKTIRKKRKEKKEADYLYSLRNKKQT